MEDELTYRIDNEEGKPHCTVIFALGEEGLLPEKLSNYLRKELNLADGEQPDFILQKDDSILIQKKRSKKHKK